MKRFAQEISVSSNWVSVMDLFSEEVEESLVYKYVKLFRRHDSSLVWVPLFQFEPSVDGPSMTLWVQDMVNTMIEDVGLTDQYIYICQALSIPNSVGLISDNYPLEPVSQPIFAKELP